MTPRLKAPPRYSPLKEGSLEAVVLSAHDLPGEDQPRAVLLSTCGVDAESGPPVARHKGGNSFRSSSSSTPPSKNSESSEGAQSAAAKERLVLAAPLRELFKATLTVRLLFTDPSKTLVAEYDMRELHVKQSSWIILSLRPEAAARLAPTTGAELQPTIRLKLQLQGPYRQEIAALIAVCEMWFRFVDAAESNLRGGLKKLPIPDSLPILSKMMLIPTVPALAILAAMAPVLMGVFVVGMPIFGPIVAILGIALVGVVATGGFLAASSAHGRAAISSQAAPLTESLLSSPAGQAVIYDTGPRPSPVSFARYILPSGLWGKLIASLVIDLIGSASYLIPVAGELTDLVWAPIQTTLIMAMYDEVSPNLKYVSFAEEILFFTDIVPTATIGWAQEFGPQLIPSSLGQDAMDNMSEIAKLIIPAQASSKQ